jgi:hypothetical protein
MVMSGSMITIVLLVSQQNPQFHAFCKADTTLEHDGYGGMNNRFNIPAELPLTPPPEQAIYSEKEDLDESMYLEPDSQTALPSPVASPRDVENDSGTEIEAPSISDWEPTSDSEVCCLI